MIRVFVQLPPIGRPKAVNTGRVGNEHHIGAANEKPAFDDSHHSLNPLLQLSWISDRTKAAVENAVTAVGAEGLARCGPAKPRRGTDRFQSRLRYLQAKSDHFHRNRRARAELINQLETIHNYCEAPACCGNNLLMQQGAAQSLDKIECAAFHLVRTVDGKINL